MNRRLLLCTDLDRTVLPNGSQPESGAARRRFARLAEHPGTTLAYVTGRDRRLVSKAIANYCLPPPDYVISDVGTAIYAVQDGAWQPWPDWEREIAPDWAGLDPGEIRRLLHDIVDLQQQEPAKQNLYKSSFYVPLYADTKSLELVIHRRLQARGVRANLVWSVDEPRGVGLLDILPARASKKHAISFLMQHNGFTLGETVFAGDSGNDLPVLTSEIPAVLVANASAAVREAALEQAAEQGHAEALYIAHGGFLGMNGNYTAGVLEGVVHFRPELRDWLTQDTAVARANG